MMYLLGFLLAVSLLTGCCFIQRIDKECRYTSEGQKMWCQCRDVWSEKFVRCEERKRR